MSLRFLKKKDGSKVLQQQQLHIGLEWTNIPMVEEENVMDRLYSVLNEVGKIDKNRGKTFVFLVSTKIMEEIQEHNRAMRLFPHSAEKPNSFMCHRLYEVPDQKVDIKLVVEV